MPLLAQLSAEDVGVVKLAIGVFGALFIGLVSWVAVYMRKGRELADEHSVLLPQLELRLKALEDWRSEARPTLHKVGNLEQRVEFLEDRKP